MKDFYVERVGGTVIVYIQKELDHHLARKIREEVDFLIDRGNVKYLILDFGGVSFMDSSGLAVILKAYKRMEELGRTAWVEHPPKQILRVLQAGGIDRVVEIKSGTKEEVK